MATPTSRSVTLVLTGAHGRVRGVLPPLDVPVPWWQEAAPVVAAARERFGVQVTVLRLLHGGSAQACGGPVTYLAECDDEVPGLAPWAGPDPLAPDPLRMPWAVPGGPAADLRWAEGALEAIDRPLAGRPEQVRTWNLSSLWRLPTAAGLVWLKAVPRFFAHEGAVLRRLDPAVVPTVLAHDGARVLLDDLPGDDLYGAQGDVLLQMVSLLVGLQAPWVDRCDELLALGVPDRRAARFVSRAQLTLERTADQLDPAVRRACVRLLDTLDERFRALADCGLPDTLVHGDFHSGNLIGDPVDVPGPTPGRLALLDWGDCVVGNPLLDRAAFLAGVPADEQSRVQSHWAELWRTHQPGCHPERAATLIGPVAALHRAVVYDGFLQAVEPSERVYHAGDPARWLARAVASAP
ncbi:MAG TPA: aminoglycoside phosphotransferase family protein [Actinomycetales bacterium]